MTQDSAGPIGFIGLGVMGEPMCANLAAKVGCEVIAYDINSAPLARLTAEGVRAATDAAGVVQTCNLVLLSLPGGPEVEAVVRAAVLAHARPGLTVVDMSTAPVGLTRALAAELAAKGAAFADAPVARTRQAARDGTLSITVGAAPEVFAAIRPVLAHMGSEVTHCGPVGCGQVVKLMNNMVLFQTVVALAEAMAIAGRAGVDEELLLKALSNGSADSFALRNHGMKAMLPRVYPEGAFPTDYALKDLSYALALATESGVQADGAELARALLERSRSAGQANRYFPALLEVVAGRA